MKVEINLPEFPGFYNSYIDIAEYIEISEDPNNGIMTEDQFDQINWNRTHKEIAKWWLGHFIDQNKEDLEQCGVNLTFKEVDSPRFYNYSTDKLVCIADVDIKMFIKKSLITIIDDIDSFDYMLKHMFTDRPGFHSYYSNKIDDWIEHIIDLGDNPDNVVFETMLSFLTEIDKDDITYDLFERYLEFIEYKKELV